MLQFDIRDLAFSYPTSRKDSLKGVNLPTEKGAYIVLCGKSCSGKPTLLRQLKSVLAPHRFFGQNSFYTTAANRMSRCVFHNAVTAEDVTTLYKMNMED